MGMLDEVIGGLMCGAGGGSPLQSVLTNMLSGGSQSGGMGTNQSFGQGASSQSGIGGLAGLIGMFTQAGLGHVAQSWVGNGPNQSVSPQQLQDVFGQDRVSTMSEKAGMDPGSFLSQLSHHLPSVVNGMTPNGRLPDEGTVSV
jgi:uncharacterized protein YidB (DUF937 family)